MIVHSRWTSVLWMVLALLSWRQLANGDNWQENVRPKLFAQMTSRDYQSFIGNPQLAEPAGTDKSGSKSAAPAKGTANNMTRLLNQEYFTMMLYTNLVSVSLK